MVCNIFFQFVACLFIFICAFPENILLNFYEIQFVNVLMDHGLGVKAKKLLPDLDSKDFLLWFFPKSIYVLL
jgi:hypothetical protein